MSAPVVCLGQSPPTVVQAHEGTCVVLPECGPPIVVHGPVVDQVVVEVAVQGVPGPPGKQGIPGPAGGALLIDNRLNEFAGDTAAQEQAQANLGLGVADPLAYYILAKS